MFGFVGPFAVTGVIFGMFAYYQNELIEFEKIDAGALSDDSDKQ